MNKAIFPGSFDPFHDGHKFVIEKALEDFDFIYIVISWNENKKRTQSFWKSKLQIKKNFKKNKKIKILFNKNKLTIEIARKLNCFQLIRGIRNENDIKYEDFLRKMYIDAEPRIKIKYYNATQEVKNISSSTIRSDII